MWDGRNLLKFMFTERLRERLLSGPTVDIYVGVQRQQWSLHQNLLTHHSSYCERQFHDHEPMRSASPKLELRKDDPIGFELLVKWLYQGILEDSSKFDTDEAKYEHAVACFKLWLLCDRFEMIKLKNLAMDQYRRCLHESQLVPDADEINDIYRSSPAGSPFRSLMVKIAARQIMDPEVERDAEAYRSCFDCNPEFAIEMVTAIRQMSEGILFKDPTRGDACSYHDHADVSGCPMQGKGKARAPKTTGPGSVDRKAPREEADSPMSYVELSAERRTPRKLRTPFKSPSAALTYQEPTTPRSLPSKLNGLDVRHMIQDETKRPTSQGSMIFDNTRKPGETLQLRIPEKHPNMAPSDDLISPLLSRNSHKRTSSIVEVTVSTSDQTCAAPQNSAIAQQSSEQQTESKPTAMNVSINNGTRKRKMTDRTPRKLREKQPVIVPITNGDASSRAESDPNGPRKLRVSSIVRRLNESSSGEELHSSHEKPKRQVLNLNGDAREHEKVTELKA